MTPDEAERMLHESFRRRAAEMQAVVDAADAAFDPAGDFDEALDCLERGCLAAEARDEALRAASMPLEAIMRGEHKMTEAIQESVTAGQPGDGVTLPEVPATAEASATEPASKSKRASWPTVARVRTGIVTKRHGLGLSRPGRKTIECWHDAQRLRRELESEVRKRNGGRLPVLDIARVQSVCRLEVTCRAFEKTLRENESMPIADQRSIRESICRLTREKDNLIAALLTDRPESGLDWTGGPPPRSEM